MINKVFNWTLGSFFRTLGRILVYVLIGYVLFSLVDISNLDLFLINVKADSLAMKTSLNGDYSKQTWFNGGRNNTLSIFSDYAENQTLYTWNTVPRYGYVEMCTNANITSYYSANPNSITDIEHINTNIPCNQGTMHGTIQYFLITTDVWSCSTSPAELAGRNCVFGYSLVFYQQSAADYYIIEKQFVDEQIRVDKSSGYLIGQNNTIINQNTNIINNQNGIQNSLNNDNVDESTSSLQSWFSNFNTNTHGLTGIITSPLNAINSLASKTCQPLILPLPFVNKNLTLPCMRSIYEEFFGNFITLYDIITLGIVSYWVLVRIFTLVKDFKNPDHDEVEVLDL